MTGVTPKSSGSEPRKQSATASDDVEAFLASLDHPRKAEILALRRIILDADPRISEGIKWNAPSFRTSEFFATFHLRAKHGVQVILHLGAKKRDDTSGAISIADPESLLVWLAADRASAKFRDMSEIERSAPAFANVIRHWIEHL